MSEQPYRGHILCYISTGRVSHLIWDRPKAPGISPYRQALCGALPPWYDPRGWWGTGSQKELEVALARPVCKSCLRRFRREDLV